MSEDGSIDRQGPAAPWKGYGEYKDPGVPWLGQIPAHWDTKPLKALAPFVSRGNGPDYVDHSPIRVVNQACIYWDGLHLENVKYQEDVDVSGWKGLLRSGDLLVNSTGTGTLGRAAVFEGHDGTVIADSHVTIVRVSRESMLPRYALYLVQTRLYQGYIYADLVSGSTNQIELSRERLRSTPFLAPPVEEQYAIVDFLDRETARMDALIAKKEQLIELLHEKRTAVISHAVTKGLQPDVPMKDSGIDWVGEIPAHWRVAPLRYLTSCLDGKRIPLNSEQRAARRGPYPYWGANGVVDHIDGWLFDEELVLLGEDGAPFFDRFKDVAFAVKGKIWVNNHIHVLRPAEHMSAYFLAQSLNNVDYVGYIEGSTRDKLTQGRMKNILIQRPPADEQRAIEAFLRRETAKMDALMGKARGGIDKLNEYRAALISAAVTGKIDVRQAAA